MSGLVKICGLREPGNILGVMQLRLDWIGLIFYPGSPRFIPDPASLRFLNDFPGRPLTVGVFVNQGIAEVQRISKTVQIDAVQLHGSESPEFCNDLKQKGFSIIKAFGIRSGFDFNLTAPYDGIADFFLFDSPGRKQGGTGEQFDWTLLNKYNGNTPFLLSGGLSGNTKTFPDHGKMAGIDLNSRFETAPGIKDVESLKKFLKQFRNE